MKTIIKILVLVFFVIVYGNTILAQQNTEHSGDTLAFSIVKMKDGTLFIGEILDKTDKHISFRDNTLGQITIPVIKIKKVEEEFPSSSFYIELANGNKLSGTIQKKRVNDFDFSSSSIGVVTIKPDQIINIKIIEGETIYKGDYWFPNPNATRYFFAPSAIPLEKGEGYYQNAYVIANSANFGVSSNISIGGGLLLPVAAYITPKIGFRIADNFYLGAGVLLALLPETTQAGIAYGLATVGNIENNLTLGVGYGFVDDESTEKPLVTINGMFRVSKKVAFVTENWIVHVEVHDELTNNSEKKYQGYFSYGLRFMWDKFTIDAAFINGPEIFDVFFIGVPYIDFVVKF